MFKSWILAATGVLGATAVLTQDATDEYAVGRRADWIFACSHEDLLRFHRVYEFSPEKMRVIPNGVRNPCGVTVIMISAG